MCYAFWLIFLSVNPHELSSPCQAPNRLNKCREGGADAKLVPTFVSSLITAWYIKNGIHVSKSSEHRLLWEEKTQETLCEVSYYALGKKGTTQGQWDSLADKARCAEFNPRDPNSGTKSEGQNQLLQAVLWPPHKHGCTQTYTLIK